MTHPNRRSTDPDDGERHAVLQLVESTAAKFIARVLLPIVVSALCALTMWVGRTALDRIDAQGHDIQQVQSDLRVISTRLDERVIRQVDENKREIEDHEHRLQLVERKVGM